MKVNIKDSEIIDNLPGGVLIYRADKENEEILFANKELLRIFDCETFDEFIECTGGHFKGMVHPEDYLRVEETIWNHIEKATLNLDYVVYRIVSKTGVIKEVDDIGRIVNTKKHGLLFFVFLHDTGKRVEVLYETMQRK